MSRLEKTDSATERPMVPPDKESSVCGANARMRNEGRTEELAEARHSRGLTEQLGVVPELGLHGEERVLHRGSDPDAGEDLVADDVLRSRELVNGVHQSCADGTGGEGCELQVRVRFKESLA